MIEEIATTLPQAKKAIKAMNFFCFSTDLETRGIAFQDRWAHGGSYEEGDPTGVSFCDGRSALYIDTCGWTRKQMDKLIALIKTEYEFNQHHTVIAHNAVFDLAAYSKYGWDFPGAKIFDTMTASHLVDENRVRGGGGHGLKRLAEELLGEETMDWDEVRFDQELFHKYALQDAIWTYKLAFRFMEELKYQGLVELMTEIEVPFQRVLLEMEVEGVGVDLERIDRLNDKADKLLTQLEIDILEHLGVPYEVSDEDGPTQITAELNINSNQQMVPHFLELGIALEETTAKGRLSLSSSALEPFSEHPFVKKYLEYKKLKHMQGHFINKLHGLVEEDGRMRPNWNNTGTKTGRLSCSSPNFQNLPREDNDPVGIRECIRAKEGYKLIAIDFSGQENRIMAELSADHRFIKLINEGQDQHLVNANAAFNLGIPEEKLNNNHKEYKKIKEEYAEKRAQGKVFSFAVPYGADYPLIQEKFGVTEHEAKRLMANYWKNFPKLKKAIDATEIEVQNHGYVKSYTGRRRRFPPNKWGRVDHSAGRQAFNFKIQGFGADLMRIAANRTYAYAKERAYMDLRIVMLVHDELVAEVKEEYANLARQEIEELFASSWDMKLVPLAADSGVGDTYAEAK